MKNSATKVGMLGLGNYSTLHYIDLLNKRFQKHNEQYSTFPFVLYNVDFQNINPFLPNQFDKLLPIVKDYVSGIKMLNVNYLIIPNITIHETIDQFDLGIPLAHPLHLSAQYIKRLGNTKTVVFGTKYTMNSGYVRRVFSQYGIELLTPTEADQLALDAFRTNRYSNTATETEIEEFQELKRKYGRENPVLIACTELSIGANANEYNVIDMAMLQVEETIHQYTQGLRQ